MSRGGDRDFIEMTFRTVKVFRADGKVDLEALDELVEIALRDGHIDAEERAVMSAVLDRIDAKTLSRELATKVAELRERFGL
jgi:tellurite resistance protein